MWLIQLLSVDKGRLTLHNSGHMCSCANLCFVSLCLESDYVALGSSFSLSNALGLFFLCLVLHRDQYLRVTAFCEAVEAMGWVLAGVPGRCFHLRAISATGPLHTGSVFSGSSVLAFLGLGLSLALPSLHLAASIG